MSAHVGESVTFCQGFCVCLNITICERFYICVSIMSKILCAKYAEDPVCVYIPVSHSVGGLLQVAC